jgi:hypothetical protein
MDFLSARQLADKTALVLDTQDGFSLMLSQVDGQNRTMVDHSCSSLVWSRVRYLTLHSSDEPNSFPNSIRQSYMVVAVLVPRPYLILFLASNPTRMMSMGMNRLATTTRTISAGIPFSFEMIVGPS